MKERRKVVRVCLWCGADFEPVNDKHKFCQPKCRQAHYRAGKKGIKKELTIHKATAVITREALPEIAKEIHAYENFADMSTEELVAYLAKLRLPSTIQNTILNAHLSGLLKQVKAYEQAKEKETTEEDIDVEIINSREFKEYADFISKKKEEKSLRFSKS